MIIALCAKWDYQVLNKIALGIFFLIKTSISEHTPFPLGLYNNVKYLDLEHFNSAGPVGNINALFFYNTCLSISTKLTENYDWAIVDEDNVTFLFLLIVFAMENG